MIDIKNKQYIFINIVLSITILVATTSWSSEEDSLERELDRTYRERVATQSQSVRKPPVKITERERFERTQWLLKTLGAEEERGPSAGFFDGLSAASSSDRLERRRTWLESAPVFQQFVQRDPSRGWWRIFQDPGSYSELDFEWNEKSARFVEKIPRDFNQLRILIDPGHMGGELWDERTGKVVRDAKGHRVSEGVINLQVALLLEQEFERLGATVELTRRTLGTVTDLEWEKLPVREYGLKALRKNQMTEWFRDLIASEPAGEKLLAAFRQSPEFQSLFKEIRREGYFNRGADLEARIEKIRQFRPHLTLVIHHDAGSVGRNWTKAYVPGGYSPTEYSTREDRRYFFYHWLDEQFWPESVRLAASITQSISKQMGIPLQPMHGDNAIKIQDGVFARNLYLHSKFKDGVIAFLECFFYDHPPEYRELLKTTHPLQIGGKNVPYSDRLLQAVHAIRDGVLEWQQRRDSFECYDCPTQ